MNRMVEPDSGTEDDRSEGVTTAGEWQDDHDAIPVAALLDEDGDTEFADGAVAAFNLVVCEFTFAGIFSEPTSRLHIGSGVLGLLLPPAAPASGSTAQRVDRDRADPEPALEKRVQIDESRCGTPRSTR